MSGISLYDSNFYKQNPLIKSLSQSKLLVDGGDRYRLLPKNRFLVKIIQKSEFHNDGSYSYDESTFDESVFK